MPYLPPTHGILTRPSSKSLRDRNANRFYASIRWRTVRSVKLNRTPWCEHCKAKGTLTRATVVHHTIEVRDDMEQSLDLDNLVSLCMHCHSKLHMEEMHAST